MSYLTKEDSSILVETIKELYGTQVRFAKKTKLSAGHVSKMICSRVPISPDTAKRLIPYLQETQAAEILKDIRDGTYVSKLRTPNPLFDHKVNQIKGPYTLLPYSKRGVILEGLQILLDYAKREVANEDEEIPEELNELERIVSK